MQAKQHPSLCESFYYWPVLSYWESVDITAGHKQLFGGEKGKSCANKDLIKNARYFLQDQNLMLLDVIHFFFNICWKQQNLFSTAPLVESKVRY